MSKQAKKLRKFVSLLLAAIVAVSCFSVSAAATDISEQAVSYYFIFGDVNLDGEITIVDATAIMFHLIELDGYMLTEEQKMIGDVDEDGYITINDATAIQFKLADLDGGGITGKPGPNWAPAPFENVYFMNTENWVDVYIYTWDKNGLPLTGAWPGSMMSSTGWSSETKKLYYEFWTDYYSGEYNHPRLSEVAGIIFSDGKGNRSIGVKVSNDYEHIYYPSEETDPNGNIIVTPNSGEDISQKIFYSSPQITLTDKTNSGQFYAYAWDKDANWLFGGEPGMEMTSLGDGKYSVDIPQGAVGIVFHNENDLTVEVTDFSCTSFCIDGTKDESGRLNLIPQYSDPIIFADSQNWEKVNVCAWDSDGNELMGGLPGTEMTFEGYSSQGERIFSAIIPESAVCVRFASGTNDEKTVEAKADKEYYRPTGKTDKEGSYLFYFDAEPEPEYEGTFYLADNFAWGIAYVYAWDKDGEPLSGEWPGTIEAETFTNYYGGNIFIIHVPKGAVGVVVSNGSDQQTEDITNFNASYWPSGQQNELGHYLVWSWSEPSI